MVSRMDSAHSRTSEAGPSNGNRPVDHSLQEYYLYRISQLSDLEAAASLEKEIYVTFEQTSAEEVRHILMDMLSKVSTRRNEILWSQQPTKQTVHRDDLKSLKKGT